VREVLGVDYAVSAASNADSDLAGADCPTLCAKTSMGILKSSDRMRLTMQKRPRALLFHIVAAKDPSGFSRIHILGRTRQ
jgi:hypothetical protein